MKVKKYRKAKNIIEKRRQKEAKKTKRRNRRQIVLKTVLTLAASAFPIGAKLWLGRKKLTLLTLLWLASLRGNGYNFGGNSSKKQIQTSKQEVHRLHRQFQQLPALQSQIKNQEYKLEEASTKLKEKEIWGEKISVEYSMLENDIDRLTEKLVDTKNEQSELNKKCGEKDQKINNLENKINELELESTKDNLVRNSYTKTVKEKEKIFKELIELSKKKLEILQESSKKLEIELHDKNLEVYRLKYSLDQKIEEFKNYQKVIEKLTSYLELAQTNLQEKTDQLNQNRFEIYSLNTQAKKDLESIEELQEKLTAKEKEFSQFEEELAEVRQELKSLTANLEKKDQLKWVFYAVNQILNYKVFKRFK
jgi:chromosome segregation ATPase